MRRVPVWAGIGFLILFFADNVGVQFEFLSSTARPAGQVALLVAAILTAAATIWFYKNVILRRWANREPDELASSKIRYGVVVGLPLGAALLGLAFLATVLVGASVPRVSSTFEVGDVIQVLILVVVSAVIEEVVFRGLLFHALQPLIGWKACLAITALFFGAAHQLNAHATLWSSFAIAIEGGVLFGLLFIWKHNLWLTMGVHAGWNLMESLLGVPVSGQEPHGFLDIELQGAPLITGGEFGIEASLITFTLSILVIGIVIVLWRRSLSNVNGLSASCSCHVKPRMLGGRTPT
ncbi:hypothetical protein B7R21_15640 [Subtercola boreus]|uniref:CAAX prenyl protease 2/Lysostaphin resistance protein A-like domain-containing protein n=2 Tax=Subtercola boreus TaxID=120213 RepID=A0A3E0VCZ3_9MICO|nr:hypothetical protein B7R21_15640 [Subtercola boreus]